jgi:transcriptional regulator with XRE-family HTH domain
MKNMELKEKLVALRKEKGLTQLAVAEKLDVSRQAISRWESGVALPSTDNLKYLSSLYEVPVDYLLKEDSEMKNNPDNEPTPDKIQSKRKKAVIIAIALIGILAVGIFGYFLTCNNEKCIDVADAESDQWNESQTEIEIDW